MDEGYHVTKLSQGQKSKEVLKARKINKSANNISIDLDSDSECLDDPMLVGEKYINIKNSIDIDKNNSRFTGFYF
jgi:hypothetical protein